MKFDFFIQKVSNLQMKNQIYKFMAVAMAIAVVVNSSYTYKMLKQQRIIIVPPGGLEEKVGVSMTTADEQYLKTMTRYICGLLFTYSPATARGQFSELLSLYHPSKFQDAKDFLYGLAEKVETSHVTSIFNITAMKFTAQPHGFYTTRINGVRILYSKDAKVEEKKVSFLMKNKIDNGRFYILDIMEVSK